MNRCFDREMRKEKENPFPVGRRNLVHGLDGCAVSCFCGRYHFKPFGEWYVYRTCNIYQYLWSSNLFIKRCNLFIRKVWLSIWFWISDINKICRTGCYRNQ